MEFSIVLLATFLVVGFACLWFAFYEDDLMRQRREMQPFDRQPGEDSVPRLAPQPRSRRRRARRYAQEPIELDRAA